MCMLNQIDGLMTASVQIFVRVPEVPQIEERTSTILFLCFRTKIVYF